ncbi:polyamine ABC transporter substrate-binding protein [Pseudomonas cichorii]|uniref:polyamine ABC transporter substrate-binding protein n=1 Tax=Pseudomonas cichorii TaxID=36746 RepID=UPI0019100C2B|nr:polyamine ABC transporter substrate-binding protein [Pseudomonas cichorii]GFM80098.1 polyamine ABC transporter substrate-binding protein [Pseudomonas cichorii]
MLSKSIAALMLLASTSHAAQRVNIYNWTDYIAPDTVRNFQEATGIKADYQTYETNEALNARLMARHSGYDVVVPSVHFMARQIDSGALKVLDKRQLPNWKNLNPVLLKALEVNDPGNQHGFPYLWGSTGIGYDVGKVKALLGDDAPLDSWDLIFKPENMKKLAQCGVAILDNAPEVLPITLNYLGLPAHSEQPEDYAKAATVLSAIRPYVRYFDPVKYIADLGSGKICVALGFSGDIAQAQDLAEKAGNGIKIGYTVPSEGAPMWFDMVAMPVDAPNEKAGYAFMNYLLRPEVMAHITNEVKYANGNEKADALIDPALWTDTNVYPNAEMVSRMFVLEPVQVKIEELRARIWADTKAAK